MVAIKECEDDGPGDYFFRKPRPWVANTNDNRSNEDKCTVVSCIAGALMNQRERSLIGEDEDPIDYHLAIPFMRRSLASGVHAWMPYEHRLKNWLAENKERLLKRKKIKGSSKSTQKTVSRESSLERPSTRRSNSKPSSANRKSTNSKRSVEDKPKEQPSMMQPVDTEEPEEFQQPDHLRFYYTLWNMDKIRKKKLETREKVLAALDTLSQSDVVEKMMKQPPKGGVQHLTPIESVEDLSAKGQEVLMKWARNMSTRRITGDESGEDEDPVEMWNRSVSSASADSSIGDITLDYPNSSSSIKRRKQNQVEKDEDNKEDEERTNETPSTKRNRKREESAKKDRSILEQKTPKSTRLTRLRDDEEDSGGSMKRRSTTSGSEKKENKTKAATEASNADDEVFTPRVLRSRNTPGATPKTPKMTENNKEIGEKMDLLVNMETPLSRRSSMSNSQAPGNLSQKRRLSAAHNTMEMPASKRTKV